MSLIDFPNHIKPARVTAQLRRVDETIASPLTNVQQVVSRGNPVWGWTFEFTDLSESEREVVQAFLLRCKGSVNTFRVTDPGDYEIRGTVSDWIDVFSGYGSFNVSAGSDTLKVNSWFSAGAEVAHHVTDERTLRMEWLEHSDHESVAWFGHGSAGEVNSLESGKAYLHRVKHFTHSKNHNCFLAVHSGAAGAELMAGPGTAAVSSPGVLSTPFFAEPSDTTEIGAGIGEQTSSGTSLVGAGWEYADYQLKRCALVANSENLLTRSNNFAHADWTQSACSVQSGANTDPKGGSDSWQLFVNSDEASANHYLEQAYTKLNTEDLFCASAYVRASTFDRCRLELRDGAGAYAYADFIVTSGAGATSNLITNGTNIERPHRAIVDVTSGYYRIQLTALISSHDTLNYRLYAVDSDGNASFATTDSMDLDVFGFQMTKFPFPKPYRETTDAAVVGSGWQTGSTLVLDGFDGSEIIKAGQRFELINQYHNTDNSTFERSEFKRVTKETVVHREGWAEIEFDPPIRNAPATDRSFITGNHRGETLHNAVIFHQPEMKARLVGGTIQYIDKSIKAMDVVFDVIEDMTE